MKPDHLVPGTLPRQIPVEGVSTPNNGYDHLTDRPNGQLEAEDPHNRHCKPVGPLGSVADRGAEGHRSKQNRCLQP